MLDVPIEMGDAHDYGGGLFNMTQNKIPKEKRQRFKEYFMIESNPETRQFTTELGPMLTQLLDYAGVKDGNKVFSWVE